MPFAADKRSLPIALTAVGSTLLSTAAFTPSPPPDVQTRQQVVAHRSAVSERGVSLTFEFADGSDLTVALTRGRVVIDGEGVAPYARGGVLEGAWLALVEQSGSLDPAEMLQAAQAWTVEDLSDVDQAAFAAVGSSLTTLAAPRAPRLIQPIPPVPQVPGLDPDRRLTRPAPIGEIRERLDHVGFEMGPTNVIIGDLTIAADQTVEKDVAVLRGDVHVEGHVIGNVVAVDGDVLLHGGGMVDGDVLALNGDVIQAGGVVHGSIRSVSEIGGRAVRAGDGFQPQPSSIGSVGARLGGLAATFVALAGIGFGLVLVAPRQLETVADTIRGSFWRSFLAGLLAQSLIVPIIGLLILGLILTVVGILLLPFAILGIAVVTILAVVGGYLAAAHSAGEAYLRRRMAMGHAVGGWLSYRYVIYGLVLLMAIWGPAFLLGWVPVAGFAVLLCAALFTWVMITAGFGATIISRAGIRGTFVRRFDGVMTDQYLYHTPEPTPVVQRFPGRQP